MTDLTQETMPKRVNLSAVFWAGLVLLFLMALICLLWLSLFAEALLVPYECCDLAAKPSLGSWQRTINDFFAAFPGRLLPTLLFFLASGLIFRLRLKRAENRTWLPLLFFGAYVFLFLVSLVVTDLSWVFSNRIVGPRIGGIDAGYHRTWYGLASHLILWLLFFIALAKIRLPGDRPKSR